jgi:S-formylglutathione hydrolase FrmB
MILSGNVFSKSLEMNTGISVIIPNNFKKEGQYKIACLLHGICGTHSDWIEYTMLPLYANEYDVIFVAPEAARSFYTDMKFGFKYYTYVSEELPEICRSIFNISSKREDTAIIGVSMGGFGALKCALSKPEQYGMCSAIAPANLFMREFLAEHGVEESLAVLKQSFGEQLAVDFLAAWGAGLECAPVDDLPELARLTAKKGAFAKMYLACGFADGFYQSCKRFSNELSGMDYYHKFEAWEGAHEWFFFNEALRRSLQFFFGNAPVSA